MVTRQNGITPSLLFKKKRLINDGGQCAIAVGNPVISVAEVNVLEKDKTAWTDAGRKTMENLNTFFGYPPEIRNAIYTTNAIEPLNSVIRQAVKKHKVFPTDDSVRKVIYLAISDASKK